jgi:hypothetical protein
MSDNPTEGVEAERPHLREEYELRQELIELEATLNALRRAISNLSNRVLVVESRLNLWQSPSGSAH